MRLLSASAQRPTLPLRRTEWRRINSSRQGPAALSARQDTNSLITEDPSTGFTLLRSSIRTAGPIAAGPSAPYCRRYSSHPLTITPIGQRLVSRPRNLAFSGCATVPTFCSSMLRPVRSSTLFRMLSTRALWLRAKTIARLPARPQLELRLQQLHDRGGDTQQFAVAAIAREQHEPDRQRR
jgi:hypothetical protein